MRKPTKKDLLLQIYQGLKAQGSSSLVFDNKLVKQETGGSFGNQFDLTKVDSSSRLPAELIREDLFIIHLGKGVHRFVRGVANGYHKFEPIEVEEVVAWPYTPHTLNGLDTSEA